MGMYLMRQIGTRGVYGNPLLPDFMVFLNYKELPWYWLGFDIFRRIAVLMVLLVPGLLALVFGCLAFRSRGHRRLSLDHHPGDDLRADARLLPQRHGLRRQQRPHRLQGASSASTAGRQHARGAASSRPRWRWRSATLIARVITSRARQGRWSRSATRKAARASSATGRSTTRLFVFALSAVLAGIAGALYVPQVGIINPSEFAPANSIEAVIWVAVGGRGTLVGAVLGALLVNCGKTCLHRRAARILAVRARRRCSSSSRCSCRRASSASIDAARRRARPSRRRTGRRSPPRMQA